MGFRVSALLLAMAVASVPMASHAETASPCHPETASPHDTSRAASTRCKKPKPARTTKKREDAPAQPSTTGTAPRGSRPAPEKKPEPEPETGEATRGLQRGERVEFDARLIQGQVARAGAVYLFERASTNLHSMVRERTGYRREIEGLVYRPEPHRPAPEERSP